MLYKRSVRFYGLLYAEGLGLGGLGFRAWGIS